MFQLMACRVRSDDPRFQRFDTDFQSFASWQQKACASHEDMASAQVSLNPPKDIDPTRAWVAFGDRGLPKLNRELTAEPLAVRQRALNSLCDLVRRPDNVQSALDAGKLP